MNRLCLGTGSAAVLTALIVFTLLTTSLPAAADDTGTTFDDGTLRYLITGPGTVQVGRGGSIDGNGLVDPQYSGVLTVPASVTYGDGLYLVTAIGSYAFSGSGITVLDIPTGVTSIGSYACLQCEQMTTLCLPDGLQSLGQSVCRLCTALTSVSLPGSLTDTGTETFVGCTALKTAYLSEGITSIGDMSFDYCTALTAVYLPASLRTIGISFNDCTALTAITIPAGVTSINLGAFTDCTALAEVSLSSNLTDIYSATFEGCTALTAITIPAGIESISFSAFKHTGLTEVRFMGEHAPRLDGEAFATDAAQLSVYSRFADGFLDGYVAAGTTVSYHGLLDYTEEQPAAGEIGYRFSAGLLTYMVTAPGEVAVQWLADQQYSGPLVIPATVTDQDAIYRVTEIKTIAFCGTKITDLSIPGSVRTIGGMAFSNSTVTSVVFAPGVTMTGERGFSGCEQLTSVTIPGTVVTVTELCFSHCYALTDISLGDGIGYLDACFIECRSLQHVEIPGSVRVGSLAFARCSQLSQVTLADGITEIGNDAFEGTALQTVTIPDSVRYVSFEAFQHSELTRVRFLGTGDLNLDNNCFAVNGDHLDVYSARADGFLDSYVAAGTTVSYHGLLDFPAETDDGWSPSLAFGLYVACAAAVLIGLGAVTAAVLVRSRART